MSTILRKDIVLDEETFNQAIKDFEALGVQLQSLRNDIEEMMDLLKDGFNTPAGVKFINSCEKNLYEPLDAQKLVIEHISTTLSESKQNYDSVFKEYEALQNKINQVNN